MREARRLRGDETKKKRAAAKDARAEFCAVVELQKAHVEHGGKTSPGDEAHGRNDAAFRANFLYIFGCRGAERAAHADLARSGSDRKRCQSSDSEGRYEKEQV